MLTQGSDLVRIDYSFTEYYEHVHEQMCVKRNRILTRVHGEGKSDTGHTHTCLLYTSRCV